MEKIKNIIISFLAAFLIAVSFGNSSVYAKEKVKVYVFEAGGCPYCEAEVKYLEELSSYGEKFEIVRKQLYIDHEKWEPGEDYNLGEKVAKIFQDNGFTEAVITGTPFVVISNLYAEASYSTQLESVINDAYEKGDVDVVGCIANGGDSCWPESKSDGSEIVATVIVIVSFVGLLFLVVSTRAQARNEKNDDYLLLESKIEEDEEDDDEVEIVKVVKPVARKTPGRKKTVKDNDEEEPKKATKTTRKSTSKTKKQIKK